MYDTKPCNCQHISTQDLGQVYCTIMEASIASGSCLEQLKPEKYCAKKLNYCEFGLMRYSNAPISCRADRMFSPCEEVITGSLLLYNLQVVREPATRRICITYLVGRLRCIRLYHHSNMFTDSIEPSRESWSVKCCKIIRKVIISVDQSETTLSLSLYHSFAHSSGSVRRIFDWGTLSYLTWTSTFDEVWEDILPYIDALFYPCKYFHTINRPYTKDKYRNGGKYLVRKPSNHCPERTPFKKQCKPRVPLILLI